MSVPNFTRTYRVTPEQFDRLLALVHPHFPHSRKRQRGRPYGKSTTEHLLMFLYYIAHGSGLRRLAVEHDRLAGTTTNVASVHRTLHRTAAAVTDALSSLMQFPDRAEQRVLARRVETRHRIPYTVGCLGGCHIGLTPKNSRELDQCFMFKGFPSLMLLVVVDDTLAFRHLELIGPAAARTSTVPLSSAIAAVQHQQQQGGGEEEGEEEEGRVRPPYVLLGGPGFPIKPWLIAPYRAGGAGEQAFNARHASAYASVDRALALLKASAHVLQLTNGNGVETTHTYARAAALLHNFRITHGGDRNEYSAEDQLGEADTALLPGEEAGRGFPRSGGEEADAETEAGHAMRRALHLEMAARQGIPPPLAVAAAARA